MEQCDARFAERTEAGLVTTSDQNPPLLRGSGISLDGLVENILPVLDGQDGDLLVDGGRIRHGGLGGGRFLSAGRGGAKGAQEVLELCLVLLKGRLGRCREQRERKKGSGGHAHVDDGCVCVCMCDGKVASRREKGGGSLGCRDQAAKR